MNETIENIQNRLFLLNDKIRMMEMFLAHAKSDMHSLQEYLFDIQDQEMIKQYEYRQINN